MVRTILAGSLASAAIALAGCGGDGADDGVRTAGARTGGGAAGAASVPGQANPPIRIDVAPPADLDDAARERWVTGRAAADQSGCLACHAIGSAGSGGVGGSLNGVGGQLSAAEIAAVLREPKAPMPSYGQLAEKDPDRFDALVAFLTTLR
jgi:ubiquinol-cytochrome c reductase cytochrome b subunit/menaquinol-cytochrome c reductase cytochrome b/c subunit